MEFRFMELLKSRFAHAKNSYLRHATVQHKMQDILLFRALEFLPTHQDLIFEFGAGIGSFTKKIAKAFTYETYICNDIIDIFSPQNSAKFMCFDMNHFLDFVDFKADLVISNATMQWLNLDYFFKNIGFILKSRAFLVFSTFGSNNLCEIRALSGVGLKYKDIDFYKQGLKDFKILDCFKREFKICFESPLEAFAHLKNTGVNCIKNEFFISKKILSQMQDRFNNTLTYDGLFFIVEKVTNR